ncbi:signal peptidase II [Pukyongiella litopenaei]|uniref:Lipoprotein signal peptidase n=1 Tax=Pukyongiella litopenaei TaxID=2605946 RepID=A0A2S0MPD8_9RHOB|nr:signal peptidase II [Pukyongiella litopenaei]AVO37762.1 signal peptidase II [Pukyongiella litopenaei]
MRWGLLIWSAIAALLVDQVSKYWVVHGLELARKRAIDVYPPLLNFRYGENRGINFGLFDSETDAMRWVLIVFSLAVIAAVLMWLRRQQPRWPLLVSGGLLAGGALGNVVDRLWYGYVLDFLNMSCCGFDNPFVFNLADVFIFAGAAGLLLFEGRNGVKTPRDGPRDMR